MKNFLIMIVLIVFLSGCNKVQETQKVTLVLDYLPNTNHTGIYTAIENGYYEENGIDLEIIPATEVSNEALLSSNKAEFAFSYAENLAQYSQSSEDVVSIMSILEKNLSGFLSLQSTNITSPKDFENKTYCGWGSDFETAIIRTIMENNDANFELLEIINTSANLLDENSPCDFVWAFSGWDKIALELKGAELNFLSISEYAIDWYTPIIVTSEKIITENPELVTKFVTATIKGYEFAKEKPKESAEIFLKHNPSSDSELINASQLILSNNYYSEKMGYQTEDNWNGFLDWLLSQNILSAPIDSEIIYTNKFVDEYYDSNK